jgi:hypothetical protein
LEEGFAKAAAIRSDFFPGFFHDPTQQP